jgi:hypothetical protein
MTTNRETLPALLREYNRWRRGDETLEQPHPVDIGKMIDAAADRLEELERELEQERQGRKQADQDAALRRVIEDAQERVRRV